MPSFLPRVPVAGLMVTKNSVFVREDRVKNGRVVVHRLGSSLAVPKTRQTMSSKDGGPPRRRESRSGTRKVSHLSAEQLERKRANDREAQRSIRQRTKDHIERLERQVALLQAQVAELRPRSERFDELVQQNAALQNEVNRLKQQLGIPLGRPAFSGNGEQVGPFRNGWHMEEGPSNAPNPSTSTMLSPFSGLTHPPNVPRAPSAMSASSRSSHPHDWQQYSNTRSPSLASEPEYSAQPYVMDRQMRQGGHLIPPSLPVAPQLSFGSAAGQSQQPSESSFSRIYPREGLGSSGQLSTDQPAAPFLPSQGSAGGAAQPTPGQPYPPSYRNPMAPQSQRNPTYPYPWNPQS